MAGEPALDMAPISDQGGPADQGVERDEDGGASDPDDGVAPDVGGEPEPEPDAGGEPEPEPDAGGEPEPESDAGGEPEPEPDAGPPLDDVLVVLSADDALSEFVRLLQAVRLDDGLREGGPWTVFAPTSAAVIELFRSRPSLVAAFQDDPQSLVTFLRYHIVPGAFGLDELVDGAMLPTLDPGVSLPVTVDGDGVVRVAGVAVSGPRRPASNGGVFVLDTVLVSPTLDPCGELCQPEQMTLFDRLAHDPRVEEFLDLIPGTEYAELLRGPGPLTVLAYSNAAWRRAEDDPDFDVGRADRGAALALMGYHIIPGDLSREALEALGVVATAEGRSVVVERLADDVLINRSAGFGETDLRARNGRYHLIDEVLRPPTACDGPADCPAGQACIAAAGVCLMPPPPVDLLEALARDGRFGVLLDLIARAQLEPFLRDEGPWTLFAPIDAAFEAMPPEALAALQADPAAIEELLRFHLRAGVVTVGDIGEEDPLERAMLNGLIIERSLGPLTFSGAEVLEFDQPAGDDLFHVLSRVMTARHACDSVVAAEIDWFIGFRNTIGAGDFMAPPCGPPDGVELAYRFITIDPDEAEQLCIRTLEADFDTVLHVIEGNCRGGEVVACNDDHAPGQRLSEVEIAVQTHTVYHVFVSGATRADHGSVRLSIESGPCFFRP